MAAIIVVIVAAVLVLAAVLDVRARRHGSRMRRGGDIASSVRDARRAAVTSRSVMHVRENYTPKRPERE